MVLVDHLLRRQPFEFGANGDGRTVLVRAGHHEHVIAPKPVVAGENVGGEVGPRDLSKVERPVRIRPRHAYKDAFWHR